MLTGPLPSKRWLLETGMQNPAGASKMQRRGHETAVGTDVATSQEILQPSLPINVSLSAILIQQ